MKQKKFLFLPLLLAVLYLPAQVTTQRIQKADFPSFLDLPVSFFNLRPIDALVIKKDIEENQTTNPPRFGRSSHVDVGLNEGTWHRTDAGKIWNLGITSKGAKGFMLVFDKLILPKGAVMYIHNVTKSMLIGEINHTHNNSLSNYSSDLISSDSIIITLIESPQVLGKTLLHLSDILYAYDLPLSAQVGDNPGSLGSCNRDVVCPEGNTFQEQSKAVAMIYDPIEGRWCSGSLLNNACNDLTPTFFTAFHCIDFNQDLSLSNDERNRANTWVFRFGYKASVCGGSDNPTWYSTSSASVTAQSMNSDGLLLTLAHKPIAASNITYTGWTTSLNNINSLVSIHHPAGNQMKISIMNQAPTTTDLRIRGLDLRNGLTGNWNIGTAQGGSSGGPYFDQNQRVIGQNSAGINGDACANRILFGGTIAAAFSNSSAFRSALAENTAITQTNLSKIPSFNIPNSVCAEVPLQLSNFPNVPNGWRFADNGLNLSGGDLSVGFFNGSWTLTFVPQAGYSGPGFVEFKFLQPNMNCSNPLVVRSDFWVGAPRSRVVLKQETDTRRCGAWLTVANPQPSFTYRWKITQDGITYFATGSSVLLRRADQDRSVTYELTTANSCQSQTDWGVEYLQECNSWKAKSTQNQSTEMQFQLSPNPVRTELNIQWVTVEEALLGQPVELEVCNLSGQRVHTQKGSLERLMKLDVSNWTNGFYLLTLKGTGLNWHQKFYVNQN